MSDKENLSLTPRAQAALAALLARAFAPAAPAPAAPRPF
jgi:hypothetical protein